MLVTDTLARLMDLYGRAHWNEGFDAGRARLSVDGDRLRCDVTCGGTESTIEGHATAPWWFVSGAWASIFAAESDGKYGHRVDGRINRVWPNGVDVERHRHGLDDAIGAFAAYWPHALFSTRLYPTIDAPYREIGLQALDGAPSRTSLTGILKRIAPAAAHSDPLQRLRCAEFLFFTLRAEWSSTGADRMAAAIDKPLRRLLEDDEPAIRELALLTADDCAWRYWQARAYGLYEPLCRVLIDAGLNAHWQHARLAESAFASGDIEGGERHWAIAVEGQNPLRAIKLSSAFDHIGDWNDLRTRLYRQAGGAHIAYAQGNDPNSERQSAREKKGIALPDASVRERHFALARHLLARAAECAAPRVAEDLAAIGAGTGVPLGAGRIEPDARRLFLDEIDWLRAHLAAEDGDEDARIRLLIRAIEIKWGLQGAGDPAFETGYEEALLEAVDGRDDAELDAFGFPPRLKPLLRARRASAAVGDDDAGREREFWRRFMQRVHEEFLAAEDADERTLPVRDVVIDFDVARDGDRLRIAHAAHDRVVEEDIAAPIAAALRAWGMLWAALSRRAIFDSYHWRSVALHAEDIAIVDRIARDCWEAGHAERAIVWWRIAHGTDPLIHPWRGASPPPPAPLSLEAMPASVREAVARRSAIAEDAARTKLKPAGRRVEALAAAFDPQDAVAARDIGEALRQDCACGESEILRVSKAASPLLAASLAHPHPIVREVAELVALELTRRRRMYPGGHPKDDLETVEQRLGIRAGDWP